MENKQEINFNIIDSAIKQIKESKAEYQPNVAVVSFNTKKEKDKFIKDNREGKKVFKW